MYCANCKTDVPVVAGYCSRCGTAVAPVSGGVPPGQKGRTLLEEPDPRRGAAFVRGSTQIEGRGLGLAGEAAATGGKGKTIFDPGISAAPPQTPLSRLTGWLVSFTLTPSGDDYCLREGRNIIGSDQACDVVIRDASVSGKHAVVICRDGQVQLRDNDSTNGTYVNGTDTFDKGAVSLANGDEVRIGRVDCRFYSLTQTLDQG